MFFCLSFRRAGWPLSRNWCLKRVQHLGFSFVYHLPSQAIWLIVFHIIFPFFFHQTTKFTAGIKAGVNFLNNMPSHTSIVIFWWCRCVFRKIAYFTKIIMMISNNTNQNMNSGNGSDKIQSLLYLTVAIVTMTNSSNEYQLGWCCFGHQIRPYHQSNKH